MGHCESRVALSPSQFENSYPSYSGPGPWYTVNAKEEVKPRTANDGVASAQFCQPRTLMDLFESAVEKNASAPWLKVERPLPALVNGTPPPALPAGEWTTWTYQQGLDDIKCAAKGFIKLGMQRFDSVNCWGFNSPEWTISAFAAAFAGGQIAGLYPTDTDETAAYKVVHSGASIVVVEDQGKLKKLQAGFKKLGNARRVKAVVAWDYTPAAGETIELTGCGQVPVIGWRTLIEMGRQESDAEMNERNRATQPGHCSCLIYTSGTTGDPKAVMISHDQIIFEGAAMLKTIGDSVAFGRDGQERILSYLPLSHVAGMMIDIVCPVYTTSDGPGHCTLYFARPYDLKVGAIKDRLCVAKPTLFLGVPLVWEKIADKIRAIGAANTGVKKALGDWAKGVSLQNAQSKQLGNELVEPMGLTIASKLLSKVKEGLGLDELKFGLTGAAPIRVDTLEYFGSLGLGIYEVYGMSECCGAASVSTPQAHQWGSCGYEMHGVEVKAFIVDPADINKKVECPRSPGLGDTEETYQGELCYRGRSIMMGYMAQPDLGAAHVQEIEKKTADTIDADGWLHSGDKGMITKDGMVKITGRYKELIIGEGGENIAPVPIEDHVKKMCDGIAEVMMVGDKRKYNVALITLKAIGANGEQPGTDMLDAGAKRVNPDVSTISGAMKDKAWIDAVWAAINSANENGKVCFNNAAKIQKFTILPSNFSEQTNELTPTKKLKRKIVETSYAAVIEKMYAAKGPYVDISH